MSGSFGPSNAGSGPRTGELESLFAAAPNGNFVRKNLTGTALEYTTPPSAGGGAATWGSITGTLSAQADLNNALTALIDNARVSPTAGILASKLNLAAPGQIGATTPNAITATDLTNTARTIKTPVATQVLTAASIISVAGSSIPITSATSITLNSNPQVAAGANGQEIEIVNIDTTDSISFVDGNGLILGRPVTLFPGRSLRLRFLSSYGAWVDCNFNQFTVTAGLNSNSGQIASTAYVNTSNRPFLQAGRSTNFPALPINGWTKIPWNAVVGANGDLSDMLDEATGNFTIPAFGAGLYAVGVGLNLSANVNAMALSICTATLGAELTGGRLCQMNQASDTQQVIIGNGAVMLAASTTYSIQVFYASTTNVARDLLALPATTYLTLYRLNV